MGLAWSCLQKASLKLQERIDKQINYNHIRFMILRQVQLVHPVFKSYFQMATPTMNQPWTNPPSPNQASPSSQMRSPGWHHGRSPWEDTRNHRAHWGPLRPARTGTCRGCSCWASCATSPQGVSRWSCAQKIVGVYNSISNYTYSMSSFTKQRAPATWISSGWKTQT